MEIKDLKEDTIYLCKLSDRKILVTHVYEEDSPGLPKFLVAKGVAYSPQTGVYDHGVDIYNNMLQSIN